ncbi:pollen-specific leucine-rich repeat extensin-like protein 4 [Iris pallida]|uniref:Pollen-specific leucine-rich repeat extensin-like protein 4 n=1 Tax=Iris pallida TaxID=29817 RepID=A0AAX6E0I2_IRIPA|nr:pollen-specific leucine-rich repeat extensin-like protein 4 [Iris pallida]
MGDGVTNWLFAGGAMSRWMRPGRHWALAGGGDGLHSGGWPRLLAMVQRGWVGGG